MGGTLSVARQGHILDRHRKWDVVVDGEKVASVSSGRTCEVPLPCGKHEVWVGHRWLSSPARSLLVRHGEIVEFTCRPRPHPLIWIPYGVASLVRQGLFISFDPVTT
jgi:hypothetical protein